MQQAVKQTRTSDPGGDRIMAGVRLIRYRQIMEASELLRTVRQRHGLTQAQLAARARTSQAAMSRIERGLVSPSVATLATLLDLMGEELALDAAPIDYGHDVTLNRQQLAVSPVERIERQASFSRGANKLRNAARR